MTWLALIAGHFFADFVLQSGFVEVRRPKDLARHAGVVAAASGALLMVAQGGRPSATAAAFAAAIACSAGLLHALQDYVVGRLRRAGGADRLPPVALMAVDQGLHVLVLSGLADLAERTQRVLPAAAGLGGAVHPAASGVLGSVLLFTLGTAVTAVVIAHLLEPYRLAMSRDVSGAAGDAMDLLPRAGLWIGLCERFLLILAIALGVDVVPAVGLLLGVKSIYRFRELDNRLKAEYYLLGTLMSVTAAVVFGAGLRWVIAWAGPVRLP